MGLAHDSDYCWAVDRRAVVGDEVMLAAGDGHQGQDQEQVMNHQAKADLVRDTEKQTTKKQFIKLNINSITIFIEHNTSICMYKANIYNLKYI